MAPPVPHPLAVPAGGAFDRDLDEPRRSPLYYRVHRALAVGANASVHLAEAVTPDTTRQVALKLAHPHRYHREVLAREDALLATLSHPNLARRLGPALHADGPGLALAWAGVDLQVVLASAHARRARLGAGFAIEVAVQVCAALDALHAVGIVHGSIRPDHVLVSDTGAVTLVGFGWARHALPMPVDPRPVDPEAPEDPTMRYQVRYAAPEAVFTGQAIGSWTDVWAAALLASELVAGEHPNRACVDDPSAILLALREPLAPPADLPPAVRLMLQRALDRDGGGRPSAAALRAALLAAAAAASLELGPDVLVRGLASWRDDDGVATLAPMSDDLRATLPEAFRDPYDHLLTMPPSPVRDALVDNLLSQADPVRARLPADYRVEYDKVKRMAPSSVRDGLLESILRMAGGEYDYFDWDGVAVRVACAGGKSQTFRAGAWQDGGPSYTVRQEECSPISRAELVARFPDLARS